MKDNFSTNSAEYARFRPNYPPELFRFLEEQLESKEMAWDCATGNGQVARELAKFMKLVEATDISAQQLKNAIKSPTINYSLQPAERTTFPDSSFDFITVAQAIHWFDFDNFFKEVKRLLKPEGLIAVIGYSLFKSNPETESVIFDFYENMVGPFWDPERKYLEEHYQSIPFPFEELPVPPFQQEYEWSFEQLTGYLKTWSAVNHFEKANGFNPVDKIIPDLKKAFGKKNKVIFPIIVRLGKVKKKGLN